MELPETAKKHKIATLTTLMISSGVFSRDHISAPPNWLPELRLYEPRSGMHHCCRSRSEIV
jgi:hypothetical protein